MPSLPPGVSRKDFQDAIAQFRAAVGKEWVFTSDEDVDLYRDSYSPFWNEPEDPVPSDGLRTNTRSRNGGIAGAVMISGLSMWLVPTVTRFRRRTTAKIQCAGPSSPR
jgi:hypothetical protein